MLCAGCNAPGHSGGGKLPPVERPTGPMPLDAAQSYVLALVNHDRAEQGLEPVELDDVASKTAERHVRDMVAHGFTAHWGTDGSVPEQRYTEAGGTDFVQENAACFFDGETRQVEPNPTFEAVQLEQIEAAFMAEVPPNDGHRKNILKPVHKLLGVGLAKPVGVSQPCMSQEFVDDYGDYEALPATAKPGQKITVAGAVQDPVEFGGVGLSKIDPQAPISAAKLNSTNVYNVPEPYVMFFPAGYKTPKPVTVNGKDFSITVPLDRGPGRYGVSVWGRYPGSDPLVMISLRIITVRMT